MFSAACCGLVMSGPTERHTLRTVPGDPLTAGVVVLTRDHAACVPLGRLQGAGGDIHRERQQLPDQSLLSKRA